MTAGRLRRRRPAGRTAQTGPPLRVRQPGDLLAVVPFLLGFHPAESVVCLFLRAKATVLTLRCDLAAALDGAEGLAGHLGSLADRHGCDAVALVAYTAAPVRARPALEELADRLAPYGVADVLLADGRRWWSLTCPDGCCPPEGTAYDVGSSPLAAQAVFAGRPVLSDRSALRSRVAGPPAADADAVQQVAGDLAAAVVDRPRPVRAAEMLTLVEDHLARPRRLSDADCARLALLCLDVAVRDVAWALVSRDTADAHAALWQQVVARTADPLAAAPLCLLGAAAWVGGDGALLNCCLERLDVVAPDYSMAGLLADVSARAVPPSVWEEIAPAMAAELAAASDRVQGARLGRHDRDPAARS